MPKRDQKQIELPLGDKHYQKGTVYNPATPLLAKYTRKQAEKILGKQKPIYEELQKHSEKLSKEDLVYRRLSKILVDNDSNMLKKAMEEEEGNNPGFSIEFFDKYKKSLLYIACEKGFYEKAEFLISKKADVNRILLPMNKTCLMAASELGNIKIMGLLLKNGAKLKAKNKDGYDAITCALIWQNKEAFEYLLNLHDSPEYFKSINYFTINIESKKGSVFERIYNEWLNKHV